MTCPRFTNDYVDIKMARHLKPWKRTKIVHMIRSRKFTPSQIAKSAKCDRRSVTTVRKNLRLFGTAGTPSVPVGCPPTVTPYMTDVLCDHLSQQPGLYLEDMVALLQNQFDTPVSTYSVQRSLARMGWTKKQMQRKAQEQNPRLRAFYQHKLSNFHSYQLVFVDESGCDKRVGHRRTGWAPLGVTPVQVSKFHRGQRYHMLPAYAQDGIILSRIYSGSTDAALFEDFLKQLLQHCGRFPAPKSVLVMDNASFHRSQRVEQLCSDAGVKLLYLPPYSPDFNPIEEYFAELKAYIKKVWLSFEENPEQGFRAFLQECVYDVGARQKSAEGHFRHAGIEVEEF